MKPQAEANSIYQPAAQAIQAQGPAITQLYNSLVQGLQNNATQSQAGIMDWAARAGVAAPQLNTQVGQALQGEVGMQGAILGAGAAENQAAQGQQLGALNVDKAAAIQALTDSLSQSNRESQKNRYELSDLTRQAQLEQTKNQYSYDERLAAIKQQEAAAARARAAAAAKASELRGEMFIRGRDKNTGQANYGFKDKNGKAISAGRYAEINGLDVRDVLAEMVEGGDLYAQGALTQLAKDPNPLENRDRYKKQFGKLFWGT